MYNNFLILADWIRIKLLDIPDLDCIAFFFFRNKQRLQTQHVKYNKTHNSVSLTLFV